MKRGDRVERPNPPFGKQTGTVKHTTANGHVVVKLDKGGTAIGSPQFGEFAPERAGK